MMVTESCSPTHAKQEHEEEEVGLKKEEVKKGDWTSVATRLLALCGGLEQYDSVEGVGWRAQERRKIRMDRSGSLPWTPELVRRTPSSSFSYSIKTQTLPRERSQSSDLLSVPTIQKRTRSLTEVNILGGSEEVASRKIKSQAQIRTTTL